MPQLDPTWFASQLFWLVITFAGLYFVMARLVLPPLQEIVARRRQTVAGDIEEAQSLKSQAEHARQDYERMLADARSRAQQLLADSQAEHKAKAEEAGKALDREIAGKLAETARRITERKQELIEALTPSTAELTSMIVEKLTQRAPGKDRVSTVINSLLKLGNR